MSGFESCPELHMNLLLILDVSNFVKIPFNSLKAFSDR